jgi:imidazolonepropionase-like amidohydrolase
MKLRFALPSVLLCVLFACGVAQASDLVLVGAKIYPSPTEKPMENGSILVHDGHIVAIGPSGSFKLPPAATAIDCKGLVVTAGFWNSHVHILTPGLLHAERLSSEQLSAQMEETLTRWGFTTVFDIASVLENTALIRRRIASGEVKGPRILTVGEPFWVKGGTPIYVRDFLEANHIRISEIESNTQAADRVSQQIRDGANGIKIFAESIESNGILVMPVDSATAIVAAAHREGQPVFAHVSTGKGIEVALQSGVDILAHTTPADDLWTPSLVARLNAAHMALIPTLTLWDFEGQRAGAPPDRTERGMEQAARQLNAFSQASGQVLFGTDVGYIDHFDTAEEFTWMSRAGMTFPQILAALTTNPAQRFGESTHRGRISTGMDADLVVLAADPARDISALSKVRYTIVGGKIIYQAK